jgi:hypothetical protein
MVSNPLQTFLHLSFDALARLFAREKTERQVNQLSHGSTVFHRRDERSRTERRSYGGGE